MPVCWTPNFHTIRGEWFTVLNFTFCCNLIINQEVGYRNHIIAEFNRGVYDIIIASDENVELDDDEDDNENEPGKA